MPAHAAASPVLATPPVLFPQAGTTQQLPVQETAAPCMPEHAQQICFEVVLTSSKHLHIRYKAGCHRRSAGQAAASGDTSCRNVPAVGLRRHLIGMGPHRNRSCFELRGTPSGSCRCDDRVYHAACHTHLFNSCCGSKQQQEAVLTSAS